MPPSKRTKKKKRSVTTVKKNLPGFKGIASLIKCNNKHYVVSSIKAPYIPYPHTETLIFKSDKRGRVRDLEEVAKGKTRKAALKDFRKRLC